MARYTVLIDGRAGAYGAAFPDCPGCTAMGATLDEALTNAAAALSEWMADRVAAGFEPPVPRGPDALRADPALADDLVEATLGVVPLLLESGRPIRVNVSLDAALLEEVDAAARARGLTRSAFLASAARDKIAAEG
ncbi:type II toxin-antitoxin system HicB family antitoxin [Methylobacterium sp. NEAU 140]|uniref:type II toxin-antitoxin system HicB family antitoxin n=1 Tax=Methylobacterium sp. NEAU 140 TaxID=3064945 RepID=UPI002736872C|nr:type II toxin-antitoxin system HicB family antitoxin [Methylobacterium sp. NEAU 140]MDP4022358.1 type II toxin-antitoxin system HicB family antitoxin [Methylobacterium sp. NEAU 140]